MQRSEQESPKPYHGITILNLLAAPRSLLLLRYILQFQFKYFSDVDAHFQDRVSEMQEKKKETSLNYSEFLSYLFLN